MSANTGDETAISVNTGAVVEFLLKTALICIVLLLPVVILYFSQGALYHLFGPPLPTSAPYLVLVAGLFLWYIIACFVLLPRSGRRIERYVRPRYKD